MSLMPRFTLQHFFVAGVYFSRISRFLKNPRKSDLQKIAKKIQN